MDSTWGTEVHDKEQLIPPITLTAKQSLRVQIISHLENGKNPLKIIDELLDADAERRKNSDLSLSDMQVIRNFLDEARACGWTDAELMPIIRAIHYYRADEMAKEIVNSLIDLLKEIVSRGWEIPRFVKDAISFNTGVGAYRKYQRGEYSEQTFLNALGAT
jgi:hypothetical protein